MACNAILRINRNEVNELIERRHSKLLSVQRPADGIDTMTQCCAKIQLSLGVQIVCWGYLWILINVDEKFLKI